MPPVDYPGARQHLYLVRALQQQHAASADLLLDPGWVRSTFLGIYRDHTPEAAILTAQQDHPGIFALGPVLCVDLSAWCRLVAYEVALAVWVVLWPDGTMERGQMTAGSASVLPLQRPLRLTGGMAVA